MGVVWAAQDELLGRPVAVKEVLTAPGLTEEQVTQARQRTLHEARTAARLSSPAAVLVYDVVEEDGEPWVVMERLPSRTLADELAQRGPLPTAEVATLGLRLLDALDAAHAAGVLHRDVKPANVMFRGGPEMSNAILTDFGIARLLGDPATTATGTLIGSPAFVAPERARGDSASPASDLWSLGVTLWIAAEGISPFSREGTLQTLTAVLTADPPPLQHAGPLAPVLTGLLEKDPAHRLDSRRVRSLLERLSASHPAAADVAETATLPVPAVPAVPAEPAAEPVPPTPPAPVPDRTRQPAHDHERARGRFLLADVAVADGAHLRQIVLADFGHQIGIHLDDVGHSSAGRFQRQLDVPEHLLDLGLEIALADQLAGCIGRHLTGDIDQRALVHLGDM